MAGLGHRQFTRERLTSSDFQGYAVDQSHLVFPSANAREAELPSPSEGMVSLLLDSMRLEDYIDGGWRRRSDVIAVGIAGGTYAATQNYTLGTLTVDPGRPYRVTVRAAMNLTVGQNATGTLRLQEDGVVKGQDIAEAQGAQNNRTKFVERSFVVPGGEARSYRANLDVTAGSIAAYTDDSHSYLQAEWAAL